MTCVKRVQEFLTDDTSLRDFGSASDWSFCMENLLRPIRSTIQIWLVAHHQYGILVLVAQTSFHSETSCGVTKCWLFSQAILSAFENVWCNSVHFFLFFFQFASLTGVTQTVGFIGRIKLIKGLTQVFITINISYHYHHESLGGGYWSFNGWGYAAKANKPRPCLKYHPG